ncbi:MAG: hypothetical protein KAI29_02005 [Cyclobacteriaceae bacterium]|nr:hypothetical protein [Cyclobacteriaceae bacterium]MCK5699892.1 hypothetical protein [Cyclobacteriaceae bacterium]
MKKCVIIICLTFISLSIKAQDFGLSFSYFIPKNGYFSVPVTPFSIRGVGFDLNRFFAIESGFTLYRISGMGVNGLPYESKNPLIGPFFSMMVPLEAVITFNFDSQAFKLKGGGFLFYNFNTKINEGNLDRELKEYLGWEVLNSDFSVNNNLGYGYRFGAEYIIYFSKKFGISLEAYYLSGSSPLDMKGIYKGIPSDGDLIVEEAVDFKDAELDFTGYELSIGILFSP